jgi:hypothetical protein
VFGVSLTGRGLLIALPLDFIGLDWTGLRIPYFHRPQNLHHFLSISKSLFDFYNSSTHRLFVSIRTP